MLKKRSMKFSPRCDVEIECSTAGMFGNETGVEFCLVLDTVQTQLCVLNETVSYTVGEGIDVQAQDYDACITSTGGYTMDPNFILTS